MKSKAKSGIIGAEANKIEILFPKGQGRTAPSLFLQDQVFLGKCSINHIESENILADGLFLMNAGMNPVQVDHVSQEGLARDGLQHSVTVLNVAAAAWE